MPLLIFAFLLLCACSAPSVRCDGHLTPINAPAPVGTPAKSPPRSGS